MHMGLNPLAKASTTCPITQPAQCKLVHLVQLRTALPSDPSPPKDPAEPLLPPLWKFRRRLQNVPPEPFYLIYIDHNDDDKKPRRC